MKKTIFYIMDYIYIRSKDSNNTHKIHRNFLPKIELLAELVNNTIDGTEEFPIELTVTEVEPSSNDSQVEIIGKYTINTDRQLAYIEKYYALWESDHTSEDYIEVGPVTTSDPSQILQPKDIKFINEYLENEVVLAAKKLHETFIVDYNKYMDMAEYASNVNIAILGTLLISADLYLKIKGSLSNKIYAFVASVLFDKTLFNAIAFDNQSTEFYKKQKEAVEKFYEQNKQKYELNDKEYMRLTGNPLVDESSEEEDED